MYIKSGKRGIIEIDSETATAALVSAPAKPEDISDFTIVLGPVSESGYLAYPGEYEYGDLSIVSLESAEERKGVADIFRVTADKVEILFLSKLPADLDKDGFELLGNIDVVILSPEAIHEDVVKFIKKIDPYIVIAVGSDKAAIGTALGMEATQVEKKFKFTDRDFTSEEPTTALYLLSA